MICRDTLPMGGCVGGSMGGSGQITNNLINLNIIEIIQFCLRHPHPWVGVWIDVWMGGSVGQWMGSGYIAKYQINLDLIEIIQFCLKIYELLRHPHLWVGEWVASGQVTNFIKLELINIIQFCMKTFQITKIK